jgi:hypothetical protein
VKDQREYPKNTVVIDWNHRTIGYRNGELETVEIQFAKQRLKGRQADRFHIVCVIALIQRLYTDKDGVTAGSYLTDALWGRIADELGWECRRDSVTTYWGRFRNPNPEHMTITVSGTVAQGPHGKECGQNLFSLESGMLFLGQLERQPEGRHKVWSVQFVEETQGKDPKFVRLEEIVTKSADTIGADLLPKTRRMLAEVVRGVDGTPYELKLWIPKAAKTLQIVGPNLYRIVQDEAEAVESGVEKYGDIRKDLREWLGAIEGRKTLMLLCDPRSHAAVVHYAMVFGTIFIDHLCKAIRRYREWQEELGRTGLDIRVTNAVPLSMMVVDADADNPREGFMLVTPMACEPLPRVRPAFVVKRSDAGEVFKAYYAAFEGRWWSVATRPVTSVSEEELTECDRLKTVFQRDLHGFVSFGSLLGMDGLREDVHR